MKPRWRSLLVEKKDTVFLQQEGRKEKYSIEVGRKKTGSIQAWVLHPSSIVGASRIWLWNRHWGSMPR